MVQLDTEFNVENISSEGKHDLFHFTYQGCSQKAQLFWILVLVVILPPTPHPWIIQDIFSPKWSDSPQNMSFVIFLFVFHLLCWIFIGPFGVRIHALNFCKCFSYSCIESCFLFSLSEAPTVHISNLSLVYLFSYFLSFCFLLLFEKCV